MLYFLGYKSHAFKRRNASEDMSRSFSTGRYSASTVPECLPMMMMMIEYDTATVAAARWLCSTSSDGRLSPVMTPKVEEAAESLLNG